MNKKMLLTSLMSIAMLTSIASGATYALFTAEDNVNIAINSARVDVYATISPLSLSSKVGNNETIGSWANGGTATLDNNQITLTNMTPGDKVSFNITVTNNSNVKVQARNTYVASGELLEGLKITGFGVAQACGFSNWETLDVGSAPVTYPIEITFDEDAGNTFQEKTAVINFAVEAVQGNAEVVNPYDYDESTHTYTINDETGMMMLGNLTSNFYDYGGGNRWTVKLSKDMDMSNYEWEGLSFGHFTTLDGQGHTVKNLNCVMDEYGRSGLISIVKNTMVENLVLENVTSAGTQAGIVAGHALHGDGSYTHFKNVTIKGNNTVSYQKSTYEYQEEYNGVGAVFGVGKKFTDDAITIADGATVTVKYNDMLTRMETGNEFAFRFNTDTEVPVVNNGTVTTNGSWYALTGDDGLAVDAQGNYGIYNPNGMVSFRNLIENKANLNNKTISLLDDMDMTGTPWVTLPKIHFEFGHNVNGLVFDGNGHTISNMEITGSGMFDMLVTSSPVTFKNITMDNITASEPAVYGGNQFKGVFVGNLYSDVYFDNVTVSNSKISGYWGLGAFVGIAGNENTVNVYFNNCAVRNFTIDAPWNYFTSGFVGLVNNEYNSSITFAGSNVVENFTLNAVDGKVYESGGAIHSTVSTAENVTVSGYVVNYL